MMNARRNRMDYARWSDRYDIFYEAAPEGEFEFYLNAIARSGGSVLELGVGTGRIAIPAAVMGASVTGVDLNRPMLDRAREKVGESPLLGSLELIQSDMCELDLPKRDFDLVIIPAHTLALVTEARLQLATLQRCAEHMARDGTLIFNLFNPTTDLINAETGDVFLLGVVEDDEPGVRHVLTGTNDFDVATQTNRCVQTIETIDANGETIDREELLVEFRYLFDSQVIEMLDKSGLRLTESYGDFDGTPLTNDSEEMIYVCRLR